MAFHKKCGHCYGARIIALVGFAVITFLGTATYAQNTWQVNNGIDGLQYGENIVDYNAASGGTATGGWYGATSGDTKKDDTVKTETKPKTTPKPVEKPEVDTRAETKSKATHLSLEGVGIGDSCQAGSYTPEWYVLNQNFPAKTQGELKNVMKDAFTHDRRLRRIRIYDDQVDLYYLQPGTFLGMDFNYLAHIKANSTTWNFTVEEKSVANNAKGSIIDDNLNRLVPVYLTDEVLEYYKDASIMERDAKVIEIANQVMYQVPLQPHSNSFFVCYIVPYFVYLLLIGLIVLMGVYLLYRRYRKSSLYSIQHHTYENIGYQPHRETVLSHDDDDHYSAFGNKTGTSQSQQPTVGISFGNSTVHVSKEDTLQKNPASEKNDGFTYSKSDFKGFK